MRLLTTVIAALASCVWQANAKAAFAHFMVSNAANYTHQDWADEIKLAQDAHIDAFALNIAYGQNEGPALDNAFGAAGSTGFKMFLSFDYAGNGPWPKDDVIRLLNRYGAWVAHYRYQGQPFASTFEGPGQAEDWIEIKASTGCYFVPDWSSVGAKPAMELAGGVADGLFSWAAWPWGDRDMDTYIDASYAEYLKGKPYMMPVSPWFYTNLPGFDKNWLWRGDDLWFDRWQQVLYVQPEWVQIISWNDFGECHHIGPIVDKALGALDRGRAPYDFVSDMPHDAWRKTLPFAIDMYIRNTTTVSEEGVTFWYRKQPSASCGTGQTSGNTASQLQLEFSPLEVAQDRVFFTALLTSPADVSVSIGGAAQAGEWSDTPEGGIGLYHGSVPFNGVGRVSITLSRNGASLASGSGIDITNECEAGGLANWNAWVGYAKGPGGLSAKPLSMDERVCVAGDGTGNFSGLCKFACGLGYCPLGACYCTKMGEQREHPEQVDVMGYPAPGLDANYAGLCAFSCRYGYCPEGACATYESPLTIPDVSPFTPPACIRGTGPKGWNGLCDYACNFGFCPIGKCTCLAEGALNQPPPIKDGHGGRAPAGTADFGLCNFACSRGDYCPPPCVETATGGGEGGELVFIDPIVWDDPTPVVSCIPPCVIVLPPLTLRGPSVITFPPYTTTITQSWVEGSREVTELVVTFPPLTTDRIELFNFNITAAGANGVDYTITPSIFPSETITIDPPPGVSSDPITLVVTSTPESSTTWPTITETGHPSTVRHASDDPGPTCPAGVCGDRGGGTACKVMCSSCGILGCGGCIFSCGGCLSPFGCGGFGGGGGGGGGCVGPACHPQDCVGGGCEDHDDCDEPKTVDACTASCSVTLPSLGATTFTTDCYTTRCTDSTGCNARATTTTTRTTSGCPTLPPYVPWYSNDEQLAFTPGDAGWGGYVMTTGTYVDPAEITVPSPDPGDDDSPPPEEPKPHPPDVNGQPPAYALAYWEVGGKGEYRSYDLHGDDGWNVEWDDICDWKENAVFPGADRLIPTRLADVPVFGDMCIYRSTSGFECEKWKKPFCQKVIGGFGDPLITGKCGGDEWGSLIACEWNDL